MGFSAEVYAGRRRVLMDRLGSNAAAVFVAAPVSVRSNDVDYPYRQDSDLLYLTGLEEPESVCLLLPGHPKEEFILFVRPRDPEREAWTGRRAGVEGAVEIYGAQAAYTLDKLDEKVGERAGEREYLYYRFGRDTTFNQRVVGWLRQWQQTRPRSGNGPVGVLDPAELLHEMRLLKGEEELACMRTAVAIAAAAHRQAMQTVRDGMREFEIEALLDCTFRKMGGSGPAYPSIVAAGANATTLHYVTGDARLRDGELLLIDAGAEYGGYCSDITRTYPIGRRYTAPQRAIYDLVLQAQRAAIDVIRPGSRIEDAHLRALDVLVDGLLALGLLRDERQEILSKELYKPFFMHRTSHWLGMDVHDAGKYKVQGSSRLLEAGMVLTVEPGLYIGAEREDVDPQYRGVGVRIEDDVLVTRDGHEVLTAALPKERAEVEDLRSQALSDHT